MESDRKSSAAYEQPYHQLSFLSAPPRIPPIKQTHDSQQPNGHDLKRSTRVDQQIPIPYNLESPHTLPIGTKAVLGGLTSNTGSSSLYSTGHNIGQSAFSVNSIGAEYGSMTQSAVNMVPHTSFLEISNAPASLRNNATLGSSGTGAPPVQSAPTVSHPDRTRRRVTKACDRCRLHKVKCSGIRPCQNCVKHEAVCDYNLRSATDEFSVKRHKTDSVQMPVLSQTEIGSGSELSTTIIPNSHPQALQKVESVLLAPLINTLDPHVRTLENRIAYLEGQLFDKQQKTILSIPTREFIPKLSYIEAGSSMESQKNDIEAEYCEQLYSSSSVIDIFRTCTTKRRICTKPNIFLTMLLCGQLYKNLSESSQAKVECPRTQYYGWNLSGCHYLRPETIPPFPDMHNFSDKYKEELVNYFFREINPLYAILHESVFREQLNVFLLLESEPLQQGNRTALFLAMLALVYTLSIRFQEFLKPNGPLMDNLQVEDCLFKYAFRVTLIFSLEWESFEIIQCWLLATLYLRVSHKQCSFSNTLIQGLNMVRLMGLGRKDVPIGKPQTYESLKAKRIFFSAFCFDRIMGLQSGKFLFFNSNDICRAFPLYDFGTESDEWLTLPALAMIHISRLTFHIELYDPSLCNPDKFIAIEQDLVKLGSWLDTNGFSEEAIQQAAINLSNAIDGGNNAHEMSATICAQVKMYFCDLIMCVYGKLMFQFVSDDTLNTSSVKYSFLLKSIKSSLNIIRTLDNAKFLFSPWYITLTVLVSAGIYAAAFLTVGKHEVEARAILKDSIHLIKRFQDSAVYDGNGALVFRERFKMVGECMWILKLINHMIALKHEEALKSCQEIGIDHGSSDVNKHTFELLRVRGEKPLALDVLIERQNLRTTKSVAGDASLNNTSFKTDSNEFSKEFPEVVDEFRNTDQPDSSDFGMNELLGNLQWFDQWLGT